MSFARTRLAQALPCAVLLGFFAAQPAQASWSFSVDLNLTPRAERRLHLGGITLSAELWGWPLPNKQLLAEDDGKIHIGQGSARADGARRNRVSADIRIAKLDWVKTQMVTITAHGDDVRCTSYEATRDQAMSAPHITLTCKAAGE